MTKKNERVVAVSGGFDPIHSGHLSLLKAARALGDTLVVILNNDDWLRTKKGYVYMNELERKELLLEFPFVDEVVVTDHALHDDDRSVCRSLELVRPGIFANGGDRGATNTPEQELCERLGITLVFGVGGSDKRNSSSKMTERAFDERVTTERPWGSFKEWTGGATWHLKTLVIKKGGTLSLQSHEKRDEMWVVVEGEIETVIGDVSNNRIRYPGDFIYVPRRSLHRIASQDGATLVEVALGEFDETDITRYEDVYGRS